LSPEQIEEAKKQAAVDLQMLAGMDPEAVEKVANWLQGAFMLTGYTELCRELRKYASISVRMP
jgi:hypothetical protein